MAGGPLGCAENYDVVVHDRFGRRPYGSFEDVVSLTWSRVLDDTSEAEVVITTGEPECCELLSMVYPWCNDLSIFRDGELVWQGPIMSLDPVNRDQAIIKARDITAWLDVRVIHNLIDFTATGMGAADLVTIARALVVDALQPDDPNVIPLLTTTPLAGITGERRYEPNSEYAGAELRELARTGIDFTAIGHRLILAGELPFGRTFALSDEDFTGDLNVIVDGLAYVTRAIVQGEGVLATSGGVGDCGLVERLIKEEAIKDQASAQAEADSTVSAGDPVPVYLEVPDGSGLDPNAPVSISELVPGVVVPVTSAQTCRTVAADLRLRKLEVTFDEAGERVAVTLVPQGATIE